MNECTFATIGFTQVILFCMLYSLIVVCLMYLFHLLSRIGYFIKGIRSGELILDMVLWIIRHTIHHNKLSMMKLYLLLDFEVKNGWRMADLSSSINDLKRASKE